MGARFELPDIDGGEYIKDAFVALGMQRDGVLSWSEIHAYSQLTGNLSDPWEAETVRSMSIAYLDGLNTGEDPLAIPPMERDA